MARKNIRRVTKVETSSEERTPIATASLRSRSSSSDFNPDYTYVKQDLKKIGIMAGSFIGVLIILTFFLR